MTETLHVLMVEDHDADAELIALSLTGIEEDHGVTFRLTRATTCDMAEDALKDGGFDIVLLDLHLPDAVSVECLDRIVAFGVPCVVLTGSTDWRVRSLARTHGAAAVMRKRLYDPNVLAERLLDALVPAHGYHEETKTTEDQDND